MELVCFMERRRTKRILSVALCAYTTRFRSLDPRVLAGAVVDDVFQRPLLGDIGIFFDTIADLNVTAAKRANLRLIAPEIAGRIDVKFPGLLRSEEHNYELQSLMRNSYAVFCLNKEKPRHKHIRRNTGR